jgi:hypothetical protein
VESLGNAIGEAMSGPAPAPRASGHFRSSEAAVELLQVYQAVT